MVITEQHQWVKHTIAKVETLKNDKGDTVVFVDPEQQELAEEDAVYGCNICGCPMPGNEDTKCPGEEPDET